MKNPALINQDPYGEGWLVKIKVKNWDSETEDLHTGDLAMDSFEDKMEAEGFAGC